MIFLPYRPPLTRRHEPGSQNRAALGLHILAKQICGRQHVLYASDVYHIHSFPIYIQSGKIYGDP